MKKLSSLGLLAPSFAFAFAAAALVSGCSLRVDGDGTADGAGSGSGMVRSNGQALGYFPPEQPKVPEPTSHCTPAPALFAKAAVCVCGDMSHAGRLVTRGIGGDAADVAVLGDFSAASGTRIDGSLRVGGDVSFAGDLRVADHLYSAGDVSGAGDFSVGGDLGAKRGLSGAGSLTVGGQLRAGDVSFAGDQRVGQRGAFVDPGAAPCGCDAASRYDVAGAVAAAKLQNDNVRAGLPLDASALVGTSSVTLKSGRYYLSNAQAVGKLTLNVEGAVQLYLEGDIGAVGEGQVKLAKGATLDLFVDGKLTTVGEATFGDPSRPEAFRLYVGGKNAAITFAGKAGFHGLVYAPEADLSFAGEARIQGGLVAKHVSYAGELTVEGARVWSQPETCEDPAGTVPAKPEVVPAVPH
jgi:choice-of-anchor A domain-containing protein